MNSPREGRAAGRRWQPAPALKATLALHAAGALTFDDGRDPLVTPRVLDLLDRYDGNHGRTEDDRVMVFAVLPVLLERLRSLGLKSVALRTALEPN